MEKGNYSGQLFDGRYKILRTVGSGGMAIVFEAIDLETSRRVAIKMLKDVNANSTQALKRFLNESKAVAMLDHPNIVKIHGISVRGEHKYIVMEYIDGITLRDYMKSKGVLEWREAIDFVEQILAALDHAHSKGVVHRDIKPQNIMLREGGIVKVTDFGIAKIPKAETLTMADKAIGTVYYLSPEQAQSKTIDLRSDIYSVGVMLYEMVTGQLPFVGDSPYAVITKQIKNAPRRPSQLNPRIPMGLEQIILCAMSKNPDDRYRTAPQMIRHLRRLEIDPSVVFVTKTASQKTSTSQTVINKTTLRPEKDRYVPATPSFRGEKSSKGKQKKRDADVPLALAICIFVAFLALAVLGVILMYELLIGPDKSQSVNLALHSLEFLLGYGK